MEVAQRLVEAAYEVAAVNHIYIDGLVIYGFAVRALDIVAVRAAVVNYVNAEEEEYARILMVAVCACGGRRRVQLLIGFAEVVNFKLECALYVEVYGKS